MHSKLGWKHTRQIFFFIFPSFQGNIEKSNRAMTRQHFTLSVFIQNQMYPKITSKTCPTSDTDHDCHKIRIEHDIVDKPVGKAKIQHNIILLQLMSR